jgi:hypothetical protein
MKIKVVFGLVQGPGLYVGAVRARNILHRIGRNSKCANSKVPVYE